MAPVSVRYIVDDVDAAIRFYTEHLGFDVSMRPGPGFAALVRGDLRLLLSAVGGPGGAAQAMPDRRRPEPGGWNRIQLEVEDLPAKVEALKRVGAHFRNEIVSGMGGQQILLEDPAGNAIELFQAGR
jgi:catechol 2,3-dioxygenase-like lactoylglutathione lyase family enzyme